MASSHLHSLKQSPSPDSPSPSLRASPCQNSQQTNVLLCIGWLRVVCCKRVFMYVSSTSRLLSTNSQRSNLSKMGPTFCLLVVILVLLHAAPTAGCVLIIPAPHFPLPSSATKGFNAKHAALLDQRGFQDYDGGHGVFACQTGTCYSGADGYVRCCSIRSTCAPRTVCFEYGDPAGSIYVNEDTDGYLFCSNPARGICYTNLNIETYQSAIYCNSVGGIFTTSFISTVTSD